MTSVQLRVSLLTVGMAAVIALVSFTIYSSYSDIKEAHLQLHGSYELVELSRFTQYQKYSDDFFKRLQVVRERIQIPERQSTFSSLIQAYASQVPRLIEMRLAEVEKNEQQFILYQKKQLQYLESRMLYFGVLGTLIVIIGLFGIRMYLMARVFRPLSFLGNQMFDFLNGKYTYEFGIPQQDEVGTLQTSFNSMAQKVLQNMDELKALDKAKSEFLNIASHELRTPMTSIKGSLGLITSGVMGELDPQAKELIAIAESETDRLIRLINDILDMAKIESGRMTLNQKWIPLDEMINRTIAGIKGLADRANVTIEVLEHPTFEVFIDCDRVQQVLTNLLSNALKFSPAEGTVWLRVQIEPDNQLIIEVIDEGRGISQDDQAQLFQKFKQVTSVENPLVKGTGLGLAIARALIQEHHGRLGVYSQVGKGSNFFFTIPEYRELNTENVLKLKSTQSTKRQEGAA